MTPAKPQPSTTWASGAAYDAYMGRWSRLVAREFLTWLALPPAHRWLDAGCGTGALTEAILDAAASSVAGIDSSTGFVTHLSRRMHDTRTHFLTGDVQALPFAASTFDVAVSGLVLNFVADQRGALAEMMRVVKRGGVVAIYVWDYAGGMEFVRQFWQAATALDPAAAELDQGHRFASCQPAPLAALFQGVGLQDVQVRPVEIRTVFRSFDDYWSPFLGGQGAAPTYIVALSEEARVALHQRLRADLPIAGDGSIPLTARAWAVRGQTPSKPRP